MLHSTAGKTSTDDIFEHDVQTQSGKTFFRFKEKAEVKSLSLKTGSPILALRCPRTIAEDERSIADLYRHHSEDRFYKSMGGMEMM